MDQIPEFWRTEVWHPLSVHFPIALLIIATLLSAVSLFPPSPKKVFWENSSSLLLLIGVATAWVAVYTGDLADGTVSRKICDPTVVKDHENAAYISTSIFTAALVLDMIYRWTLSQRVTLLVKKVIFTIILIVGSGFLIRTGHLGASLVYQQAAGVYQPSKDCNEFN